MCRHLPAPPPSAAAVISGQLYGICIAVAYLLNNSPSGHNHRSSREVIHHDFWRGMAVVACGPHYQVLPTQLRIDELARPDWHCDVGSAEWKSFVPELKALYNRTDFPKP